jgi:hypothetical protein
VGGVCDRRGRGKKRVQGVGGKAQRKKRQLGRPKCRWEDGNKMDLREVGWGEGGGVDLPSIG